MGANFPFSRRHFWGTVIFRKRFSNNVKSNISEQTSYCIYRVNLPSYTHKIIKCRRYVVLRSQDWQKSTPKMAAWERLKRQYIPEKNHKQKKITDRLYFTVRLKPVLQYTQLLPMKLSHAERRSENSYCVNQASCVFD